jgi:hypothetical protein
MSPKTRKILLAVALIVAYLAADILMDILLFPRLPESLQERHRELVESVVVVFGLVPLWILGLIFFERRENKPAVILVGSALAATVVFAFTSLPFIWIASAVPALAPPFLFLHDHGLLVYFAVAVSIFGVVHVRTRRGQSP